MRYSDIKEKYVYYVDFNPVKACEFNNNHLAVVLKKNNDKKAKETLEKFLRIE